MADQPKQTRPDDSSWKVLKVLLTIIGLGLLLLVARSLGIV